MPRRKAPVPKYRLHKPSGQAVVTIRTADGARKDVYLGSFESEESRREYARIVGELATGAAPEQVVGAPVNPTVDDVLLAFWMWAEQHYRRPDGTPTNELAEYKFTLRPLRRLYGNTPAKDFGPLALKTVRKAIVEAGNARTLINARVGRIKRVFEWAASEQLVPVSTYTALATVAGLQHGRTEARESEPVGPVDLAHVGATLPYLNRQVTGIVRFLTLTGCRPGEACALRRCDIDTSGSVWLYRPRTHKTAHRGKTRVIAIGPRTQEVLKPFFTDDPADYLFSPAKATAEMRARRSAARKTPRYPSHMQRNATRAREAPRRVPAAKYTPHAVAVAVSRAVDAANSVLTEAAADIEQHVPHWHPHQLRHAHATAVRKRYGLESAGAALGHSKMSATEIYAERDGALAVKVASEMG